MTLFIGYTILMTVLSIMNGIFTYRIFKQLEMGVDMGKNKKALNKSKESNGYNSLGTATETFKNPLDRFRADYDNKKNDESNAKEEFDGSFSNPFAEREVQYVLPGVTNLADRSKYPLKSLGELFSENDVIEKKPLMVHESSEAKEFIPIDGTVASKTSKSGSSGSGMVNIPIITDEYDFPEDDERMLNRLLFLSDYLNEKYKPLNVNDQEFEDMKWETVNETYCLITVDLPRSKAEVVRKYFRRLDTTYARRDGTYYSKVLKGDLAKEVIDDLIEVYPWYEVDKNKVKVNWDAFRKSNTNVIKVDPTFRDDHVYQDRIKYAIGNLGKAVEKLNEILSGK